MTVEKSLYLKKEYTESYDVTTGDTVITMRLNLDSEQIRSGLIKEVGSRNFAVLVAIASFVNADNVAFPSIGHLAEITGLTRPTIVKAVKELEQLTIGGEQVIKKTKIVNSSGKVKSLYHFVQGSKAELAETVKPADYIGLFCKFFEEQFGRPYLPNYGRDTKLVKDKLMTAFSEEDLPQIIEIAVKQYSKWSNNPKYPTPTIGALCTWLANKAADELAEQKKQEKDVADRIAVAERVEQLNPLEQLDLL